MICKQIKRFWMCGFYLCHSNMISSRCFSMKLSECLILVLISSLCITPGYSAIRSFSQQTKCPEKWEESSQICYKFVRAPERNFQDAHRLCRLYKAELVSIDNAAEHEFISNWLWNHDPQKKLWLTGGTDSPPRNAWFWSDITGDRSFTFNEGWLPDRKLIGDYLMYNFSNGQWGWDEGDATRTQHPYICEIPKRDVNRMTLTGRDHDYGLALIEHDKIPRGPMMLDEPVDAVYDGESPKKWVSLRCVADAYPYPTYKWFKLSPSIYNKKEVEVLNDNRYRLTDGTLTIHDPSASSDRGQYQCMASNKFGSILSTIVELNFGYLNDFPGDNRQPVRSNLNMDAVIECRAPPYYPAVRYVWYRQRLPITVAISDRIFSSMNGNLYFSKVEESDEENYICLVQNTGAGGGRGSIMKTSKPIKLTVSSAAGVEREPQIEIGFPRVFPKSALAGEEVRIECVAQGDPVPKYNWTRVDGRMPAKVYRENYDRVLVIPDVQPADTGVYKCEARNREGKKEETVYLSVSSAPIFTIELQDQHVDIGEQVNFTCEAYGQPSASYKFLRNGVYIQNLADDAARIRYRIDDNTLTIPNVQNGDEGMYQCEALNVHGYRYSSAQLRALDFAPNVNKYPMPKYHYAARGGNATMICRAEGAPSPSYRWTYEGRQLQNDGHYEMTNYGELNIRRISDNDKGRYTCRAYNNKGSSEVTTELLVLEESRIITAPKREDKISSFERHILPCEARVDPKLDLTYIWKHNGQQIDFYRDRSLYRDITPIYRLGYREYRGSLVINNATFGVAGDYECIARTPIDEVSVSTRLTVIGPPSRPTMISKGISTGTTTADIEFSFGSENGDRIRSFSIEGQICGCVHPRNEEDCIEKPWKLQQSDVSVFTTSVPKVRHRVTNLSPACSYRVRIIAYNSFGPSKPSDTSHVFSTVSAPPTALIRNVTGGGGKIGDLTIRWTPLTEENENGEGIGYRIFWRKHPSHYNAKFEKVDLAGRRSMYVAFVTEDNYYTQYEVKVQPYNNMGNGTESKLAVIYSAESMPVITPQHVRATQYNATALRVTWTEIDQSREAMRGLYHGVRVIYYKVNTDFQLVAIFPRARHEAIIIGLDPYTRYSVRVMVYNSAGNGQLSPKFDATTLRSQPIQAPTDVRVQYVDKTSVKVTWNGVTVTSNEEPVEGYKIRYWEAHQSIQDARDEIAGYTNTALLENLRRGVNYYLRVLAYSRGGDGKMSKAEKFRLGSPEEAFLKGQAARSSVFSTLFIWVVSLVLSCWIIKY